MPSRIFAFLAPTLVVLAAFAILIAVTGFFLPDELIQPEFGGQAGLSAEELGGLDLNRVVLPKPEFLPEEVVRLQLTGLAQPELDGVGILQCYCFASPENKRITGPLEHFGEMVRRGPYQALRRPQAVLIGRPQFAGDAARVLVTIFGENAQVRAFTFVLSKQREGWCRDCWMTESVYPAMDPADASEPEPAELENAT